MRTLLGAVGMIVLGLVSAPAAAKTGSDYCDRYVRILGAVGSGTNVPAADMAFAVDADRSKICTAHVDPVTGMPKAAPRAPATPRANSAPTLVPSAGPRDTLQAALQGDAVAQEEHARNLFNGTGTPVNKVEAVQWYRRAAEQGNLDAMTTLAVIYEDGDGVPVNMSEAIRLYSAAAERGDTSAQYFLGNKYLKGSGVAFDVRLARYWHSRATSGGHAESRATLARNDAVDRDFAARQAQAERSAARRAANDGPSLADQVLATDRAQRRENCVAASQGRARVCTPY